VTAELDSIPISALQHYAYCPRQCGLIHVERAWQENTLTAEGRVLHERAHEAGRESRRDLRIARSLALQSSTHGLHGVADVVEFHRKPDGPWQPFPVEYKRGRPKFSLIDAVQLCAQALCLEEMLRVSISAGTLFYGETHRRHDVVFDEDLRHETLRLIAATRAMIAAGRTPAAVYEPRKCRACSLFSLCQPRAASRSASAHLARLIAPVD
jgi:CRISPR-associated exonuclease Cas4